MKYTWASNLYDHDGDCFKRGVVVFADGRPIIMFDNSAQLRAFAQAMMISLPEIEDAEGMY